MSLIFIFSGFISLFLRIRLLSIVSISSRVDLVVVESVRTMSLVDLVLIFLRLTITRLCNGRIFIDNFFLRKFVFVMGDVGVYVVFRLVIREMGMRFRFFKGEKEKKF